MSRIPLLINSEPVCLCIVIFHNTEAFRAAVQKARSTEMLHRAPSFTIRYKNVGKRKQRQQQLDFEKPELDRNAKPVQVPLEKDLPSTESSLQSPTTPATPGTPSPSEVIRRASGSLSTPRPLESSDSARETCRSLSFSTTSDEPTVSQEAGLNAGESPPMPGGHLAADMLNSATARLCLRLFCSSYKIAKVSLDRLWMFKTRPPRVNRSLKHLAVHIYIQGCQTVHELFRRVSCVACHDMCVLSGAVLFHARTLLYYLSYI